MKVIILLILLIMINSRLPAGFDYLSDIDPTIILQPRYAIAKNFVGQVIDGYLR